ncbi:carboxyl transferase domain-containing protein [Streptosporangium sp. NPDC006013]|uniref:carboxyl transferase domain-containing protein n=1 Tax=unclassified Streptosporangium TaxID=2632669 RepID=UPI0033AECD61
MTVPSAAHVVSTVADRGSFESWDAPPDLQGLPVAYQDLLRQAAAKAGTDEAVITGSAQIEGERFALIVSEFRFLGGTIGHVAADRIARAFHRARVEGLPVLALPASGGTRMQEGASAFHRMIELAGAAREHAASGLLYVSYLRNPTTGGVYASWATQGHLTWADPLALVAFLGPKVVDALGAAALPDGVQQGGALASVGVIDGAFSLPDLAAVVAESARAIGGRGPTAGGAGPERADDLDLASQVRARFSNVVRVSGSRFGHREGGAQLHLGRLGRRGWVIFSQSRGAADTSGTSIADLHLARRGMEIAQSLRLPFVTLVDTAGAELSVDGERHGMAREISATIGLMTSLTVPTATVLLDRGAGGGALALMGADRSAAVEGAWLSPLPPAGTATLLFGDPTRVRDAAEVQRIGARQLLEDGVVQELLGPGAADGAGGTADAIVAWLDPVGVTSGRPSAGAGAGLGASPR